MIKRILITAISLLFPLIGAAEGAHAPGRVTIGTMYDGGKSLYGAYNVRYNPAASSSENVSMKFSRGTNSVVAISGSDATGNVFYCYITPASNMWEVAQEGMRTAGNGAVVSATNPVGSSACGSLSITKTSSALD